MNKKIHCPICNGRGKINDTKYGSIACLNCEGTGIVELTIEQQRIQNEIEKENRRKEFERIDYENSARLPEVQSEGKGDNTNGCIIGVICAIAGILICIYFWGAIWDGIKGILTAIFGIIVCIAILGALFKSE